MGSALLGTFFAAAGGAGEEAAGMEDQAVRTARPAVELGDFRADAIGQPHAEESPKPLWRQNAQPAPRAAQGHMIAIVIDDLGLGRAKTRQALSLKGPFTLSFISYAEDVGGLATSARAQRA